MSEPSLLEVQRWMKAKILPTERTGASLGEVPLNPQGGAPGAERLSVYSGGYLARIEEALEEAYPAVRHVTGRLGFGGIARSYAARHGSINFDLSKAGRHLPEFLKDYSLTQELPFLPDLARLEWKVAEAFHSFDQPPAGFAQLAAVPAEQWEGVRIRFQPSVSVVSSAWPVLDIWEAREKPVQEIRIQLEGRPQKALVYRKQWEVRGEVIDDPQAAALEALMSGKTLGQFSDQLAQEGEGEPMLGAWFTHWGSEGLIAGFDFPSEKSR